MNTSSRHHLLKYLTIALLLTSFAIAVFTYVVAGEELDELYDENMRQVAEALLAQHGVAVYYTDNTDTKQALRLHGEEEFLVQVWNEAKTLIYTSHSSILFPYQSKTGYGNYHFDDREWRYYHTSKNGISVQLSQPLDERQEAILEVLSKFLIPLLLQIPLLGFLIWITVGKSLRPLETLSRGIEERGSDSLHPLSSTELPLEIKPLVEALNNLLNRLDTALKAQRRFTADAAHELRTPLTAVQLQLDVLKRSRSEQEKSEALGKLSNGIKRSIHVVRQLLSLAQQDPEMKEQKIESFNLTSLAEDIVIQCESLAEKKRISLTLSETNSGVMFTGSKSSIRVLIENLLDNAIRYTPEGGKVDVSVTQDKDFINLDIIDNGKGIPVSKRERVFDRFYRTTGTEESGSGLGLAIVKRIAEQHHAIIRLSEGLNNKGLRVTVTFPASS